MATRPGDEPSDETLSRLLDAEARIDARVRACLAEAEARIETARAEAVRREAELERQLSEFRERRLAMLAADSARAIRAERDRAARTVRRLRAVTDTELDGLASLVLDRLISEPAP